ncbi:putative sodium-dependent multivitamin transporter [Homarus americanus]|uniref:putative sodium-dependent multivitamin transporter n=1 Tax=Homarus americanus TaxID=6706 RepID=UPI001C44BC2F|nr:putative sodium-dependent multivitamin transporter [Homarus americanus]
MSGEAGTGGEIRSRKTEVDCTEDTVDGPGVGTGKTSTSDTLSLDNITEVIFCVDAHKRLLYCNAITSSGNATEMYFFGTQLAISLLGIIPGTIFLNQVMLPVLYNLKIVSLNEYLEMRIKSRVLRKVGTVCQMVVSTIYMGMSLYAPSLTLSTVTNLSTLRSLIIMGTICTF